MTGQDLLDAMEIVNPELQLQAGESGVTKALVALNIAQDHLEALLASIPGCMGSQTVNATTVNGTETVAFPATLLRLDGIQFIDPTTNKPAWDLSPLYNTGGHIQLSNYPFNITATNSNGKPQAFWTNGTYIYLSPTPDAAYTLRCYGFVSASDITAGGTFAYKDIARTPMAIFANRLITVGWNDEQGDLTAFAREVFGPVLRVYDAFRNESGKGFRYRYTHDT
jgi:hypothetical protein